MTQIMNGKKLQLRIRVVLLIVMMLFLNLSSKSADIVKNKQFRGFMIDAPRTVETMEHYFRLIDFLHEENFNSVIFRLTDDEGSAYLFKSHPELKMCKGALTAEQLSKIVKYARDRGIEVIPEIESFGHSLYITQTKRFKSLNDTPAGKPYNALCPVNDTTIALMKDLYSEVAGFFPSRYFHIGCDEVNWGASEMSKQALLHRSRSQIWADYVNKLNQYVNSLGKKTIIWGDVPIYHDNEVLNLLDKDIVIIDWNYEQTDPGKVDSIAHKVLDKGFEIMGCPAINRCRWGLRVNAHQFRNIEAYAKTYTNLNNPKNLGIILTNWVPKRYLPNSQWDTYFIASEIVKNNGNYDYMKALPVFVKKHFGMDWDANWEKIYKTLYEKMPSWKCIQDDNQKFSPWSSEKQIENIITRGKRLENPFDEIYHLLLSYRNNIKTNKEDFSEFLLTVEIIAYSFDRQNSLLDFADSGNVNSTSAKVYFDKVATTDKKMLARIDSVWARDGYIENERSDEEYMWSFPEASEYSAYLSLNPSEFIRIVNKEKN